MFIQLKQNADGGYAPPQSLKRPGMVYIPPEHLETFIANNGFVSLTIEGETVTSVKANSKAHKAWKKTMETTGERKKTLEEKVAELEKLVAEMRAGGADR